MKFSKAHAYGNDFLYVRAGDAASRPADALARDVCDRHTGIGADGLILFEPTPALQHFLGVSLVFPEVGSGGTRLEAGQFQIGFGGFKDNSADPQRAC